MSVLELCGGLETQVPVNLNVGIIKGYQAVNDKVLKLYNSVFYCKVEVMMIVGQ